MDQIFYVMAIFGCGDGAAACNEARIAEPVYASAAACEADADNILMANTDLDYPTLKVTCRKARKPASYQVFKPRAAQRG